MHLVLLIIFIILMILWGLEAIGAVTYPRSGLVPFLAVLDLAFLAHVFPV